MKKASRKGTTVFFREEDHSYTDQLGNKYISVTQMLGNFFPKFDELAEAKIQAERANTSVDVYLNYWRKLNEIGTTHGTNVHLGLETYLKEKRILRFDDKRTSACVKQGILFCDEVLKSHRVVSVEKLLFFQGLIAGQIDLILRQDDTLVILDWKTNKDEISKESFNNEMGFYPFDNIPNAAYYKYVIQLNLYLWIILVEKYYFNWAKKYKLIMAHIDNEDVKTYELEILPMETMQKMVDIHLNLPF